MGHRRRRGRGLSPAVHVRDAMDRWRRGNARRLEGMRLERLVWLLLKRGDHWVRARLLGREGIRLERATGANRVLCTRSSTAGHPNVRTTFCWARNTVFPRELMGKKGGG